MRSTYIVCYDVADPKRLRRVFKVCKDFGQHLQFSVFECDLTVAEKLLFEEKLAVENQARRRSSFIYSPRAGRATRPTRNHGDRFALHQCRYALFRCMKVALTF
jgi:CRISPR-associated endonuclease Cas2